MIVSKRFPGRRIPHSLAIAAAALLAVSVFAGIQEQKVQAAEQSLSKQCLETQDMLASHSLDPGPAPLKQSKGFKMTLFLFRQN